MRIGLLIIGENLPVVDGWIVFPQITTDRTEESLKNFITL